MPKFVFSAHILLFFFLILNNIGEVRSSQLEDDYRVITVAIGLGSVVRKSEPIQQTSQVIAVRNK